MSLKSDIYLQIEVIWKQATNENLDINQHAKKNDVQLKVVLTDKFISLQDCKFPSVD